MQRRAQAFAREITPPEAPDPICRVDPVKDRRDSSENAFEDGPMIDTSTLQLGQAAAQPQSPEEAQLDRVPNPQAGTDYVARFTCPEFTSLCPVTGQPDFAILVIDYAPGDWLVESKSLKLYLNAFRNHGAFHEDCTVAIGRRLAELLSPKFLRIGGYWYPRGGIPIDVFWQTGEPPKNVWLPDQGVGAYRPRG
jgi:7-cyano-7-deazaguanine reductase